MTALAGESADPDSFSLVLGGPLFQLLRRAHLSDDAFTLARKRVVVIALFAWLPLLLLSAFEGKALRGTVLVPFASADDRLGRELYAILNCMLKLG